MVIGEVMVNAGAAAEVVVVATGEATGQVRDPRLFFYRFADRRIEGPQSS